MPAKRISLTERDRLILEDLKRPHTAEMLQCHFPSYQTLYRRVSKLLQAGLIHIVGYTPTDGRPQAVYSVKRRWKIDWLEHDLAVTRILKAWGLPWTYEHKHPFPDAEVCGIPVEFDTGSIPLKRVETRMGEYIDMDVPVILVTKDLNRLKKALKRFSFLLGRLVGCTFSGAIRSPKNVTLTHCDGDKITLKELVNLMKTPPA